jgi:hypothetical protein
LNDVVVKAFVFHLRNPRLGCQIPGFQNSCMRDGRGHPVSASPQPATVA